MGSSVCCCTSVIHSGMEYIVTLLLLLLLIAFIKRYSLLPSRLTALFSHVIPNEKTVPFLERVLNINQSGVLLTALFLLHG